MYKIPLTKPYIPEEGKKRVLDVLDSGYLTEGSVTAELETLIQTYLGVRHCIATTSCTTGLELALRCLGIGASDEVIVPAFTYPATADAICNVGATPIFMDVNKDTMLIDYDLLENSITPATKALMPVSLFGNPLDYDRIDKIKRKFGIRIVEDAACALTSEFKSIPTGRLADITVFSLHPRKFITTGEGGLVTTDNKEWADWMRSFKRFGMANSRKEVVFESIGTNYKLSDILAAIGVSQMQQIEDLVSRRQDQAAFYTYLLGGATGVTMAVSTPFGKHSYQSFCVFVSDRDAILSRIRSQGIEAQVGSYYLPGQPAFRDLCHNYPTGKFCGSRRAADECLVLPLYHDMTTMDQEIVIKVLKEAIKEVGT